MGRESLAVLFFFRFSFSLLSEGPCGLKELVFQCGSPAGLFLQFEPFVLMVVYVAR